MHIDIQQVLALSIVAVAAFFVGRRIWGQVMAFRNRPTRRGPDEGGCGSCPSNQQSAGTAKAASSPLIQLQVKPPAHLKRPSADGK